MIGRTPEVTCIVVDVAPEDLNVDITWYVDGAEKKSVSEKAQEQQFNGTYRVVSTYSILHQDWLNGKKFKCKVNNKAIPAPIERTISKATGQVQVPQVYTLAPHAEELASKDKVSVTCLVKGFHPADISVEWQSNGQPEPESKYISTPPQPDVDGSYFLYSKLTVEKSRWQEGNTFTCEVMHEGLHNHYTQKSISRSPGK